jgi:hypothetical protein
VIVHLATLGFTWKNWATLMGWSYDGVGVLNQIVEAYCPQRDAVEARGQANLASMNREDGLDWLRAVVRRKLGYCGRVTRWTALALRGAWAERGGTKRQVLDQLGFRQGWEMVDAAPTDVGVHFDLRRIAA